MFDETVYLFGQRVESELSRCEDQLQREIRFRELLEIDPPKMTMAEFAGMAGADIQFIPSSKKAQEQES